MAEIDEAMMLKAREAQGHYADNGQLMSIYRALMEAKREERERDKWQPIETAPKDGTRVLAVGHRGSNIDVIEWGNGRYLGRVKGYNQAWVNNPGVEVNPTHWQPLPPPPAIKGASYDQA